MRIPVPVRGRLARVALAVCAGGFLLAPRLAAAQERTYIEGHVFSTFTGVPLKLATVEAIELPELITNVYPPRPPQVIARATTNSSGFYSFEVSSRLNLILMATCPAAPPIADLRDGTTDVKPVRPGTLRRDIYLNTGRHRTFSNCGHPLPLPGKSAP